MSVPLRHTAVVIGRFQARGLRLQAARARRAGLQVMTMEQLACRLAGGFRRPIEDEALRRMLQDAIPETALGELDAIKMLPGMVDVCVDTLRKVWTSMTDLTQVGDHPRLAALAALETAVRERLRPGMTRPTELVETALAYIHHAPNVLGSIEVHGMTELEPCWRLLLKELASVTTVRWLAGPRRVPQWIQGSSIEVITSEAKAPAMAHFSCSNSLHEAIEALRWARQLVASGMAKPGEIAIACVSPAEFDDHFLALRSDANLDLHFVHGTKVTASRDGQAAAALADILLRGITQQRFRRLAALASAAGGAFSQLPQGWQKVLPANAPLSSARSWSKLINSLNASHWPDGKDHTGELRSIVELLQQGHEGAVAAGEAMLRGRALGIWRHALTAGPAASLDLTLQSMREDDGLEACESIVWMPAKDLAASPRPHVRLLGLNSSRWPRRIAEDRLLSDHIIARTQLDPLPLAEADRRDFETILRTTDRQVVLSHSRRDSGGRLLGRSGLLQGMPDAVYLRRHREAEHAFSETDRLVARPMEFRNQAQAVSAIRCWRNWSLPALTHNDGLVRANHPVVLSSLDRLQSASSLTLLLRNPLGFVWKYGLGLREPELSSESLVLEPLAFGNLVHAVLDAALQITVSQRGAGQAENIPTAIAQAVRDVAASWEALQAIPPQMLWQRTLRDVEQLSLFALTAKQAAPGSRSFSEVPFGGTASKADVTPPWDPAQPVVIPETGFRISGYIDRLDLANGDVSAAVVDYKTGKLPKSPGVLNGGKELQRCLYAFAVQELLGAKVNISAALLYLRDEQELPLEDSAAALADLQRYLSFARVNLAAGRALPGVAAGDDYDDQAFALPANAAAGYCARKRPEVIAAMGDAALVWEAQ